MQTIKTAAIVIFMGTVMYGVYDSLTTPPENLPADVQKLMFDNEPAVAFDEESFDAELADSLPELEINTGQPATEADALAGIEADTAPLELPAAMGESSEPATDPAAITARLSDAAEPASQRPYARTANSFELPDPNEVAADFDSSDGFPLPANNPELALTSGISSTSADAAESQPETARPGIARASSTEPTNLGVANAIRTADRQYAQDQRREALSTLSIFYNTPDLSGQQRADLLSRLDPLAREVIYSREHLLEKPYRVSGRETLVDIAAQYKVPWQLLANINQIQDPMTILPGTELKVVTGPFRAEVALEQKELTLFLGDLYAGRFPIAIGSDPEPETGTFTVQDKRQEQTYYDRAGSPVPAGSPHNPYGSAWIDLGGQFSIHGSPDRTKPTDRGCISLSDNYAADLFGILSQGSSVTIRR